MTVQLNHFYVTLDGETFAAVERSGFIREFGALEKRTTVRKDRTYTGLYLYGENTYVELLHPDSRLGEPSGIAWAGKSDGPLIYRGNAPWFRMHSPEPRLASLTDWVMEYAPEFSPTGSRADALAIYAARSGKSREREQGLFADVTGLEIALPRTDAEILDRRGAAGIDLMISPLDGRGGIAGAHLRLRRDAGRSTHRLGSTTLSLDGTSAVWRF